MIFGNSSPSAERTIQTADGPTTVKFWPLSLGMIARSSGMMKPIFQAIGLLTASASTDIGREIVHVDGKEQGTQQRTTLQAITPELASKRAEQREKAISMLTDAFLTEAGLRTLASLVMDSAREAFPTRGKSPNEVAAFTSEVSLESMIELMQGVAAANSKIFAPFLDRLKGLGAIFSQVAQRMASDLEPEQPAAQPSGPQLVKTEETSG